MKTQAVALIVLYGLACSRGPDSVELPEDLRLGLALTEMCQEAEALMNGDEWQETVPTVPAIRISWCSGFVLGLKDTLGVIAESTGAFCIPPSATSWQLIQPIIEYADLHPEALSGHRTALAILAWAEAFPCPKAQPQQVTRPIDA